MLGIIAPIINVLGIIAPIIRCCGIAPIVHADRGQVGGDAAAAWGSWELAPSREREKVVAQVMRLLFNIDLDVEHFGGPELDRSGSHRVAGDGRGMGVPRGHRAGCAGGCRLGRQLRLGARG